MPCSPKFRIDLGRMVANASRFLETAQGVFKENKVKAFFAAKAHGTYEALQALSCTPFGCEAFTLKHLDWARSLTMPTIGSGFIKSDEFYESAVKSCEYVVIESDCELSKVLSNVSHNQSSPKVLLRVKVSTDAKLGCTREAIRLAATDPKLDILGTHLHAGWNMRDDVKIVKALEALQSANDILLQAGRQLKIVNLGGSFCEHLTNQHQLMERLLLYRSCNFDPNCEIHFEPGRYISGDSGSLSCTIIYVDDYKRVLYLNTCAYGYRLTASTPSARLTNAICGSELKEWKLYGFWPSESDQVEVVKIAGDPKPGDTLILQNLGAYILGLESQFKMESPAAIEYFRS